MMADDPIDLVDENQQLYSVLAEIGRRCSLILETSNSLIRRLVNDADGVQRCAEREFCETLKTEVQR